MTDTPEAVRLADSIKASGQFTPLDELDAAAAILRRIPELETELEAAKLGEAFHDKQANEYARQVAHWIGKFDEVKVERDQLRAELEKVRWQPIETATEEDEKGDQVWLLVDGVVVRGYFLSIPFQEYRDADGFYCGQQDADAYWARVEDGEPVSPTHFQRITPPAAPTPPNADQKGQ